jgi:predicted transglutaminase-like cysteine proteinase
MLRMQGILSLQHSLRLFVLVGGIIGYPLGDWSVSALGSPDLTPSQVIALRFPDLSAAQAVALRFPGLPASQTTALQFLDASTVGPPIGGATATVRSPPSPSAPLDHLIDFRVASALPPMGHSRFCLHYPHDCRVQGIDFRRRNIALTVERSKELNSVNRAVNRRIFAQVTPGNGTTEEWIISPPTGDCKDYAITKRHELLERGWPSRSLLLSEVMLPSGEHHLVLVVRVKNADLVLDNLNDDLRLAATTYDQYVWTRIQSPQNPKFWLRVTKLDAANAAMLSD